MSSDIRIGLCGRLIQQYCSPCTVAVCPNRVEGCCGGGVVYDFQAPCPIGRIPAAEIEAALTMRQTTSNGLENS